MALVMNRLTEMGARQRSQGASVLPRAKVLYIAELADRLSAAAEQATWSPARYGALLALQAALDRMVADDVPVGKELDAFLGFVENWLRHGPQAREAL